MSKSCIVSNTKLSTVFLYKTSRMAGISTSGSSNGIFNARGNPAYSCGAPLIISGHEPIVPTAVLTNVVLPDSGPPRTSTNPPVACNFSMHSYTGIILEFCSSPKGLGGVLLQILGILPDFLFLHILSGCKFYERGHLHILREFQNLWPEPNLQSFFRHH